MVANPSGFDGRTVTIANPGVGEGVLKGARYKCGVTPRVWLGVLNTIEDSDAANRETGNDQA
jgi:hypothetical protein